MRGPEDGGVDCEVEVGGTLSSHKGMNVPGDRRPRPRPTGDLGWVEFAVEQGIDLLAVSFVSTAADLEPVYERLRALDSDIPLIAKIEKQQAAENAEEIVAAATGGIMVARGDLGIELPLAQVPVVQKRLIRAAGKRSKPAITATQMLASMVIARRPTRAEVTDVANAIYDGTDAVMLSEETAVGQHPVEAVRVMDQIARATEPDLPYGEWLFGRTDQATQDVADSVAQGAVGAVYRLGPGGAGRADDAAAARRGSSPPTGPTCRCWRSRRGSRRCAASTCSSASRRCSRARDRRARPARTTARRWPAQHGIAASGDLIAITAGPARAGAGHEPLRGPPRALRRSGAGALRRHRSPKGRSLPAPSSLSRLAPERLRARGLRRVSAWRFDWSGREGLAVATLDSPPLNLFDREMFEGLQATIAAVEADPPRALLIRAEGRAVSGGVNVAEFDGLTPERASELWDELIGAVERVEALPLPVVFAAHALTLTAAFELALGCDLILAARSAKFGLVEKVVGLTPVDGRHAAPRRARRQRPRPRVRDDRRALRRRGAGALGRRQPRSSTTRASTSGRAPSPPSWRPARPRRTR